MTDKLHPKAALAVAHAAAHWLDCGPDLLKEGKKLVAWLLRLAENAEQKAAEPGQWDTMRDAYAADARNYRATARGMQAAIAKAENMP